MKPTNTQEHSQIKKFINRLEILAGKTKDKGRYKYDPELVNRAALANLRRGLGKPLGQATEMFPYVVPYLIATPSSHDAPAAIESKPLSRWEHEMYFLVAALFALHPPEHYQTGTPLSVFMGKLYADTDSDSVERRFRAVLDTQDSSRLAYQLRQIVSLAKGHDVPLDYDRLLSQLMAWRSPSRWVQERWAKEFWVQPHTKEEKESVDASQ